MVNLRIFLRRMWVSLLGGTTQRTIPVAPHPSTEALWQRTELEYLKSDIERGIEKRRAQRLKNAEAAHRGHITRKQREQRVMHIQLQVYRAQGDGL